MAAATTTAAAYALVYMITGGGVPSSPDTYADLKSCYAAIDTFPKESLPPMRRFVTVYCASTKDLTHPLARP